MHLLHVRACNAVLVKLVDQEHLTAHIGDARARPNIYLRHVTFHGNHIVLSDNLALSC